MNTGTKTPQPVPLAEANKVYRQTRRLETRQGLHARRGRHAVCGHRQRGHRHRRPLPARQSDRRRPSAQACCADAMVRPGEVRRPPHAGPQGRGRRHRHQPPGTCRGVARNHRRWPRPCCPAPSSSTARRWATRSTPSTCWRRDGTRPARAAAAATGSSRWRTARGGLAPPSILPVPTAVQPVRRRTTCSTSLRRRNREGVVFKRLDAPIPARPSRIGRRLAEVQVRRDRVVHRRRSQQGQAQRRAVARSTTRATACRPATSRSRPTTRFPARAAWCEVRYLHAFPQSGSVYQPVYLGPRSDIPADECVGVAAQVQADGLRRTNERHPEPARVREDAGGQQGKAKRFLLAVNNVPLPMSHPGADDPPVTRRSRSRHQGIPSANHARKTAGSGHTIRHPISIPACASPSIPPT